MILKDLEEAGYNNYWQILNGKDFQIPQNRERVFVISIRKDIDKCSFKFPDKQILKIRLKDLLEDDVEDKYYLSEKAIEKLVRHSNKLIKEQENPNICACLIANYFKMGARDQQYIKSDTVRRVAGIYDEVNRKHQSGSIYDKNGISPTLTTCTGGNIQPHILVNEGTKKGYAEAHEGDSINISYPRNIKKRGRVGKQVSQTILASNNNIAVLVTEDGEHCFRIRKLTPKECWRLMGFADEDFEKAKLVPTSNTQLYKQAGNSIIVNVLMEIFKKLLFEDCINDKFI